MPGTFQPKKGHTPEIISENVRELVRHGFKQKDAIALALAKARKYRKAEEAGEPIEDEGGEAGGLETDELEGAITEAPPAAAAPASAPAGEAAAPAEPATPPAPAPAPAAAGSTELTPEAKAIIEERKKRRRYGA